MRFKKLGAKSSLHLAAVPVLDKRSINQRKYVKPTTCNC